MRDSLLDGASAYLEAYRTAGEAGREAAGELPEADDILSGLVKWCRILLQETSVIVDWEGGQELSDLLALPSNQLPLRAFDEIEDANRSNELREAFSGLLGNTGGHDTNVMASLLGRALARALVECLEHTDETPRGATSGFKNMASSNDVTHFAFEENLPTLLRNNPTAFAAIVSEVDSYIEAILENPGIGTYSSEREMFNRAIDEWRSKPSTVELWRMSAYRTPVFYGMLDLVPAIVPIDRGEILKHLDCLDFPHPIRQVLETNSIMHDRDEITAMLKEAPSCSNDGQSWNQKLTAMLVLETAEAHCHELWRVASKAQDKQNVDASVMEQTEKTLSSWLHQLGTIVMGRQDGRVLGSQWMLRKSADERRERALGRYVEDGRRNELRQEQLIEWAALGLCKGGLQGRDIIGLVDLPEGSDGRDASPVKTDRSEEWSETPRLGALSMSTLLDHMIGEPSSSGVGTLLERFDVLLALRDPAFEIEGNSSMEPRGLPANCCGYLFAKADSPIERWQKSWNLLVEQRRRTQHWHETKDGDALAPSLFMLAVGTAAIEWLISCRERNPNDEKQLWRAVFDGARDCWLTIPIAPFSEQIVRHVGRLFALHPRVFNASAVENGSHQLPDGKNVNESYSERLAEDLFTLGGDDLVMVICLLNARGNGASLATMSEVMRWHGGHVDDVLKQFKKWQRVERSIRRRPDLVAKLDELRAEVARYENV